VSDGVEISLIVRARDEASSLDRCLSAIDGQRIPGDAPEVVVVDGGSSDRTVQTGVARGARVVTLPPWAFTYGRSLNLGCANSRGRILVALSAHAVPPDPEWLGRLLKPFADASVACACGDRYGPSGAPLAAPLLQDASLARERPDWGYSNAAGAFRAELWRRHPFRDDLPGCEDKEWSLYWLERGFVCVIDPSLTVEHDHTHDPVRRIYARARLEAQGYASFLKLAPYGPRELVGDWWSDLRWYDSAARARLSHRRAARLLGAYAGRRRAARGA
jgi:glycosyltransferase involved in cell wall biosynthesis